MKWFKWRHGGKKNPIPESYWVLNSVTSWGSITEQNNVAGSCITDTHIGLQRLQKETKLSEMCAGQKFAGLWPLEGLTITNNKQSTVHFIASICTVTMQRRITVFFDKYVLSACVYVHMGTYWNNVCTYWKNIKILKDVFAIHNMNHVVYVC